MVNLDSVRYKFTTGSSPNLERWRDTSSNWAADAWCGGERGRDRRADAFVFEMPRAGRPPMLFGLDSRPPPPDAQNDERRDVRELRSLGIGNVSARLQAEAPGASPGAVAPPPAGGEAEECGRSAREQLSERPQVSEPRVGEDLSWVTSASTTQPLLARKAAAVRAAAVWRSQHSASLEGIVSKRTVKEVSNELSAAAAAYLQPDSRETKNRRARAYVGPSGTWAW
jgi:hypothetical protein